MPKFETKVVKVKSLTDEHLNALILNQIVALIIPEYFLKNYCEQISKNIVGSGQIEKYTHEYYKNGKLQQEYLGVNRIGKPFNSTYNSSIDSPERKEYYSSAISSIHFLRSLFRNTISPIDRLRLELDEQFKQGAKIARFEGLQMLAGIIRIAEPTNSLLGWDQPHFDALPESYLKLDAQLAANIYLQVPEVGGELEIWDIPPCQPQFEIPSDWRSKLPTPITIRPQKGDLILFSCRRPHAVRPFYSESRISAQMFIGYQNTQPLYLWN